MGTLKYVSKYRKTGSTEFTRVYTLDGNPEELELYKKNKGTFYREGTEGIAKGKPLFFTNLESFGENCNVTITSKGNVVEEGFHAGVGGLISADKVINTVTSSALKQALATNYINSGHLMANTTQERRNIAQPITEENPVNGATVGQ